MFFQLLDSIGSSFFSLSFPLVVVVVVVLVMVDVVTVALAVAVVALFGPFFTSLKLDMRRYKEGESDIEA